MVVVVVVVVGSVVVVVVVGSVVVVGTSVVVGASVVSGSSLMVVDSSSESGVEESITLLCPWRRKAYRSSATLSIAAGFSVVGTSVVVISSRLS